MKTSALLLAPFLCAAAAFPAEIDRPDANALIVAAREVPAEFAADAMIRIAATDKLEKPRRIELLEEAFKRAAGAGQPYQRHAVALRLDGSAAYWNRVYKQDLDALSLRLRAVETMLPLDSRKARELFEQIPVVRFPALKCEDSLVYDAGRFYDVLGMLTRQAFDGKESGDSGLFPFLQKYAGAVASPVQLAPMARVLATATSVKDSDFQTLVGSFASAMGKISGDDRSFSYSTSVGKAIQSLVEECKRRNVKPLSLLEGYRLYLAVNFSGSRCADGDQMQAGQQSFGVFTGQGEIQSSANFVSFFNEKLRMAPLAPLQEQEVTPSRLEGVAVSSRFCEDAKCKEFAEDLRGLIYNAEGMPLPPAGRNSPEWQAKLKTRLAALAEWKPESDAQQTEYFREKSGAYSELLNLAQNGPNRELVQRAWLDFVRQSPFQKVNRVEWFLPVNALIARVSLDPAGQSKFAEDLRKVNDPLIALYANLESLAPRTADRILPLL
jgi:hypothetical protein